MLRLPRKALYALEAVVDIAFNARPDPVQAKEITRRQGIPPRYLEQVMQQLVHAGVLKGVRGPRGGYVLARERRRISVADIVTAIQALERDGGDDIGESRSALGQKVVRPLWDEVEAELVDRLAGISLEELCARARDIGIRAQGDEPGDFSI
ncbi:RrF2 family transcriptional regulator [Marinibaculum pumilum]|uniref:RrF2 family transcriptional regulator n=1 Tax=Marinibaculum pumilum TaxID=1766165 RepID=A0ABV7L8J4_9PROT